MFWPGVMRRSHFTLCLKPSVLKTSAASHLHGRMLSFNEDRPRYLCVRIDRPSIVTVREIPAKLSLFSGQRFGQSQKLDGRWLLRFELDGCLLISSYCALEGCEALIDRHQFYDGRP